LKNSNRNIYKKTRGMNDEVVKKKHEEEVQIKRQYANGQKWGGGQSEIIRE